MNQSDFKETVLVEQKVELTMILCILFIHVPLPYGVYGAYVEMDWRWLSRFADVQMLRLREKHIRLLKATTGSDMLSVTAFSSW